LRRQLESVPLLQAAEVRTAADFPGATHELSGYFAARQDRLEAHLFLYELPSHRLKHHVLLARPATEWRGLLEDAAGFITASLRADGRLNPPSVNTDAAAHSLAQALAARTPADAIAAFRAAVSADPACGWCWLGWAEAAASFEGREAALAVLEASARHRDSLDPLSRSRLDLLSAGLRRDAFAAASALEKIGAASPSDPLIQLQLSESLVAGRKYAEAESALRNALAMASDHAPLWNSLAYALAYQGRYDQALEAVGRYAALDAGPNPPDSRGEILMMAGRFREAAEAFGRSYQKDPSFNGGTAMEKAAVCWLLEGDVRSASSALSRFLHDRAARNDRTVALAQARWELLLGRSTSSVSRFSAAAGNRTDPLAPQAASMLALRLAFLDPASAARWLAPAQSPDGAQELYRTFAAAALDPASIEKVRDARLQLELRALSLTARRDWPRAAEAWKAVIEASPGGADAVWRELRAYCLVRAGDAAQAARSLGNSWPVLAPGQMQLYDFLVYPALLYTRAEIARAQGRMEEARRLYEIFLTFAGDRRDLADPVTRARAAARGPGGCKRGVKARAAPVRQMTIDAPRAISSLHAA
jgi:tetratricopeptide (TPR) repeat protein